MSLMSTPFPLYDLPMYDLPELAQAHEQLWRRFVALVRHGGFSGDFALTQTCGYPLATARRIAASSSSLRRANTRRSTIFAERASPSIRGTRTPG